MKNSISLLASGLIILLGCEASKSSIDNSPNSTDESTPLSEESAVVDVEEKVEASGSMSSQTQPMSNKDAQNSTFMSEADSNSSPWSIMAQSSYSEEDEVKVSFTNNSDQTIILHNPMRKNVERLKDGEWVSVNVVYCRCRPCPAPPETREVRPGKSYSVNWLKKEDDCKENKYTQSECKPGTYRITISYSLNGIKSIENVEFKI